MTSSGRIKRSEKAVLTSSLVFINIQCGGKRIIPCIQMQCIPFRDAKRGSTLTICRMVGMQPARTFMHPGYYVNMQKTFEKETVSCIETTQWYHFLIKKIKTSLVLRIAAPVSGPWQVPACRVDPRVWQADLPARTQFKGQ